MGVGGTRLSDRLSSYLPGARDLPLIGVLTLAYWATGVWGLQYAVVPGAGTAVWPAAGIAFALLLLRGPQLWPAILIGRLATALTVASPQPLWADIVIAVGTTLAAVLPVIPMRRLKDFDFRLGALREILWLVVGGAIVGGLISAAIGSLVLWASGAQPQSVGLAFAAWTFGYGVGVLIVAPLMISWSPRAGQLPSPLQWVHLAVCLAVVTFVASTIFLGRDNGLMTWHLVPTLVWAALAFNVRGAAAAILVMTGFALWGALHGLGPLGQLGGDLPMRLVFAQQFVAVTGTTIFVLAAVADERRGQERLRQSEAQLREETHALETLNETGSGIAAELDIDRLVQRVTDAGVRLTGAQFGAFFYNVVDEVGESFMLYALAGAPREAFEGFGHPRNTAVFAPTFAGEGIVRSDDITKDARYGQSAPHHGMPHGHLPVRSYLAVPVRSRSGEVIGGLFFGHEKPGVFSERAEWLMVGIAAQAAIGIDNARLFQAAQREIAERKRGEAHQLLLINELNHRVKNTLASVQSIAAQTLRSFDNVEDAKHAFTARLIALSTAHNVLTQESWEGASLHDIVVGAVQPFEGPGGSRFAIDGPEVWLDPKAALSLAMALHELGTNAAKYGALSVPSGKVGVTWTASGGEDADDLRLLWREEGGPVVTPPSRTGFGSRLIQKGLASDLNGRAEIRFEPSGVECVIEARLERGAPARELGASLEQAPA